MRSSIVTIMVLYIFILACFADVSCLTIIITIIVKYFYWLYVLQFYDD